MSEAVFERLLGDVLEGSFAPGDPLPSERALGEAFAVNRHAVREALKRLQQAGLVHVAQGGATRVLDWRRSAGLDLLTSLVACASGEQRRALLLDVAELRACVGSDAARRCAERAPAAGRAAARQVRQGPPEPTADAAEAYAAYWETLVDVYLDRNYGGILIVWDRLFGTFQPETERVRYGLTKNLDTYNPVRVAFHEYVAMWRDLRRSRGARMKLGVLFRGPGWRPQRPGMSDVHTG